MKKCKKLSSLTNTVLHNKSSIVSNLYSKTKQKHVIDDSFFRDVEKRINSVGGDFICRWLQIQQLWLTLKFVIDNITWKHRPMYLYPTFIKVPTQFKKRNQFKIPFIENICSFMNNLICFLVCSLQFTDMVFVMRC